MVEIGSTEVGERWIPHQVLFWDLEELPLITGAMPAFSFSCVLGYGVPLNRDHGWHICNTLPGSTLQREACHVTVLVDKPRRLTPLSVQKAALFPQSDTNKPASLPWQEVRVRECHMILHPDSSLGNSKLWPLTEFSRNEVTVEETQARDSRRNSNLKCLFTSKQNWECEVKPAKFSQVHSVPFYWPQGLLLALLKEAGIQTGTKTRLAWILNTLILNMLIFLKLKINSKW